MANLTAATRRTLSIAMGDKAAAKDIADQIDAHIATTVTDRNVRKLNTLMGNKQDAGLLVTAINAPAALSGRSQLRLATALASQEAAADIAGRLAGA